MAFTTPCGKNPPLEAGGWRVLRRWLARCCGGLGLFVGVWLWLALPALAQDAGLQATLERQPDGLYLSARAPLVLPAGLEEVLRRGVPLHFVWQAEVRRSRWYWTDQRIGGASRVARLVYQPLTRRWRVSMGSGPLEAAGLSNALHQNLETLDEALSAVLRVTRWRVAAAADLSAEAGRDKLDVEFRLDSGLLPRPVLIGEAADDAMRILRQTLPVPADTVAVPKAASE